MKRVFTILAAFALVASPMATQYFDRASWLADVSGVSTDDFEDYVTADPWYYSAPGSSLTTPIGTYTAPGSLFVVHPNYSSGYDYGSGSTLNGQYGTTNTITLAFAAPTNAFAADIMTLNGPQPWLVTLSTGETFNAATYTLPTRGFFGYVGNSAVSWVTFAAPDSYETMLDNVSIGQSVGAVPEPFTMGLAALGLGVALRRRRK